MDWTSKALVFVMMPLTAALIGAAMMYSFYKKDDEWEGYIESRLVCVRIRVPKDGIVGYTGRYSFNRKQVQEISGAVIRLRDYNSDFQICKVIGGKTNVELAVLLIKEYIKAQETLETYIMWVPAKACNYVRKVAKLTDAEIILKTFKNSVDRKLATIRGTHDQVERAKILILRKTQED